MSERPGDFHAYQKALDAYYTQIQDNLRIHQSPIYYYHKETKPMTEDTNNKAKKFDNGKAPITLIPSEFLLGTANVFAFGAKKYGAHNYRLGLAHSRCIDAAMRHLLAIAAGEEIDPESGLPHVYHASCSLAMYDYSRIHHPELNDIHELIKGKDGAYAISKSTTVNPTSSPQLDSTKPTDNRS